MDDEHELTERAHPGSRAIKAQFQGEPPPHRRAAPAARALLVQDAVRRARSHVRGASQEASRASRWQRRSSRSTGRATGRGSCARARRARAALRGRRPAMLREHMPELCRRGSGLSSWRAAATSRRGCSRCGGRRRILAAARRASDARASPLLVRNYDYAPSTASRGSSSHGVGGPPRHGHERLPVGAARRRERGRAGGLAHVRRPAGARGRLRRAARPALPAADVLDRGRGAAVLARLPLHLAHSADPGGPLRRAC